MGLTVLPPNVNASDWTYTGRDRALRVGLMQLRHLPRAFADGLLAERAARGPFRSLPDFLVRLAPEPVRLLVCAGCFDSIAGDLTRPALL